jgi:phenylpropionate dioxygenase-like ring-hydroxylating dioxygenase large terminal subunit
MDNTRQIEIIDELFRQRDQGVNVDAGQQMLHDARVYSCPERAEQEWQQLFTQHPQVIGLSADLPADNSYCTVDDFGLPILATRDANGVFHAFVNACRHRGTRLSDESRGNAVGFSCPFHGWAYSNQGELKGVRREKDFGAVDKPCNSLLELPAIEHGGLLVVHPQLNGQIDIDDLLGKLGDELLEFGLDSMVFQNNSFIDMNLNWKLANDTFGETYHFAVLHKNTLAKLAYGDATGYEELGRNHRFVFMRAMAISISNRQKTVGNC